MYVPWVHIYQELHACHVQMVIVLIVHCRFVILVLRNIILLVLVVLLALQIVRYVEVGLHAIDVLVVFL